MKLISCSLGLFFFFNTVVSWEKKIQDLGNLNRGEIAETRFILTNESEKPILIENVRTTCGCTSPYWSERLIAPSDTAHVLVQFESRKVGRFSKKILVYHTGQRKAEKIWVEGRVVKP